MKQVFTLFVLLVITVAGYTQSSYYVNDNSTAGDVFTTAVGNNTNAGTAAAPFASLQYAVNSAAANDVIYVDAGTFTGQVTIDKALTIIGAGQSLTFVTNSSQLVAPPGPFTEYALIQTTQGIGDVHISNLTATNGTLGDGHTIMIQTGGSVKNCKLVNGGQSVFFRIPDATLKTAITENNIMEPNGIGINCQGGGLTATIRNNTISRATSYYAGIFAGLDFGPLPQLTIQNNIINNYFGEGILAASFNGTYTLNSITGSANNAINRNGNGGNTPIATCNWFGTSNPATIAPKIIGTVIYTPFLADGTDNSSNPGFQPVGSCGSGNTFYVNDNSTSGDVFTTAVGNDANAGTSAAPFATIQYAVTIAAVNDIIYVDAGTYTEQVTITKGISIFGAGQNATSILKPATTAPPPGPFTEQGVIQTAQNIGDINIKDVSVTGDYTVNVTPIIIQSGGSLRNCKLQGGNQGLFVRVDPATNPSAKTFIVEGNIINAEYIAVNFAGGIRLTAFLTNNNISAFNPGFSSGTWAGTDFGTLSGLTITGNSFSSYVGDGLYINSNNCTISQNSFTGAGQKAINKFGGSTINATCNWYGVANASAILPKITAGVNYYPWYLDGTDQSAVAGFQHTTESCGAGTNVFYVNDNSTSGDIFTTTIGNDANAGTSPTSPLATFGAALTKASPGATIYFDAGTYTAQNVTIGKSVTVIGTNYHVSPNSAANPLQLNSTRNAESIIDNSTWTIGADGIAITGLTFTPTGNAVVLNNTSFGNFNLSRNRVRINSLFPAFIFNGLSTVTTLSQIVNWGLNINENRFEKEDASSGVSIRVNRFGSVNINNNTFVVTGTTPRTQTCMVLGNAGIVAYAGVSNNIFDKAGTGIGGNTWNFTNINANKFINTNTAFNINNSYPESADVLFNNNILDGSDGVVPFVQYTRQGGNAAGAKSSFTAEGNTITGNAVVGTTTLLGSMNLIFNNSVLTPSLTVRNNKITYAGDLSTVPAHSIRPIMVRGNLLNAVIEKNEINLTGINQQPKTEGVDLPLSPAITLYTDNGTASFLQNGSVINILNNKINGFKNSFAAYDPLAGNDAFIGYGNIPAGVTVNVNNNSFTGDSISINNGGTSQAITANCNWYGSADAAVVVPKISANVNYNPWLTNGTDNDAATGFQPVPNSCNGRQNKFYVNDASQTGDVFTTSVGNDANSGIPSAPLATINAAITKAQAGDTIYVDAGTYAEDIVVNKGVTILGVQTGINPGSLLTRGAESVLVPVSAADPVNRAVVRLQASNIIIDGFTVNGDNPALTGSVTLNGVDINAGFGFAKLIEPSAHNNIIIRNNIIRNFYRYGVFIQSTAVLPLSGNLVENNHIDNISAQNVDGNAGRNGRGVALFTNAYASVKNNVFTRNFTGILLQGNNTTSSGTYLITGNKIESYSNGMVMNNFTATSNQYLVNENEITTADLNTWTVPGSSSTNNNTGLLTFGIFNTAGLSFNNNKINNTWKGFWFDNITAPLTVNNNSITGTLSYAIENANGNTVTANCNWYGSAAAQDFISKLTLSTVDIIPWLTNGTDNDVATGFQPVSGSCDGNPTLITLDNFTNITCNGAANGTINITTSYGKAPFTYTWTKDGDANFISHDEDPTGLAPGTYSLSIVDGNGSNIYITDPEADGPGTITVTITEPDVLTASGNGSNVNCNGGNNGTATATAGGGTAPYTYLWSNGETTSEISNLIAGIYSVTVTDANGCTAPASYEVTQPNLLTATSEGTNVSCFGGSNGSATAMPSGGTAPYTYSWSNGGSTQTISNLAAGIYSVSITDNKGCTTTAQYEVTQPTVLTVVMTGTKASCNGSTTATPAGGTAPYTYLWSNGSITQTISNVPAGIYTVIVKDANNCTVNGSFTITGNSSINPITALVNVSCFGGNNGSITVTSAGGTAPYTYNLNGSVFQSSNVFNNLSAGVYIVGIKDANGCSDFVTRTITQPALLTATTSSIQSACFGQNNGTVSISVSGGSGAKTYSWTGPNGYTSTVQNPSNLFAGNYLLQVTDTKGCTASLSATVPSFGEIIVTSTITNVLCRGSLTGAINLTVSGGTGSGFSYSWTGAVTSTNEDLSNIGASTNYRVRITDIGSGCFVNKTYIVTQPTANLSVSGTTTNVTGCNSLGSITATGSGGTSPYTYNINGGTYQSSNIFTGLSAGSYTIGILDANGCMASITKTITDLGGDVLYEPNNSRNQSKPITIGANINARIATTTDLADWYVITTPAGGSSIMYSLVITHPIPGISYTFNMYPASPNNAVALVPVSVSGTTGKDYLLAPGTSYRIEVTTTTLSFICYNLSIAPAILLTGRVNSTPALQSEASKMIVTNVLTSTVYPNPHRGSFTLQIESPEEGVGTVEMYNVNGQVLGERKINLVRGKGNQLQYNNMNNGVLFYRVRIGKHVVNGKILGIR